MLFLGWQISSWIQYNLDKIKTFLQKNGFPSFLINKHAKRYLDSKDSSTTVDKKPEPRYYKLPYIGSYSNILKKRLQKLVSKCCTDDVKLKIVFTPFKIQSRLSLKDKADFSLKSFVVYRFCCANCNASYIGETYPQEFQNIFLKIKTPIFINIFCLQKLVRMYVTMILLLF